MFGVVSPRSDHTTESLIEGPLSKTAAYLAKVATCPVTDTHNSQHVLCIYVPDVYDQLAVTEVIQIFLLHHSSMDSKA